MLKRNLKDESGQVLVITLFSMAVLFGFLALAVDVGALFHEKRNLQIVADAAATAGALDYYKNQSAANARLAAQSSVSANSLTVASANWSTSCPATAPGASASYGCTATPPSTGGHTRSGFVEVQVTQPNSTTFMAFFGFRGLNVTTRAVAGQVSGVSCLYVKNNLNIQGNTSLCGVDPTTGTVANCSSGSTCPISGAYPACGTYAGSITGSGGGGGSNCIDTNYVETAASSSGVTLNPSPAATNVPTQTPPQWVSNAPQALPSSCNMPSGGTWSVQGTGGNKVNVYTWSPASITPGCYGIANPVAGYTAGLPFDMNVNLSGASSASPMNLGGTSTDALYQFNLGNTQIGNGASAVTGGTLTLGSDISGGTAPSTSGASTTGVTLEVYTGNFTVSSTSTNINLYAPDDGSSDVENGVVLVEPASNTGTINIQWGSSGANCSHMNFDGYIIALGATLTMQDQGGCAMVSGLYVGNMNMNSTLYVENVNSVYANGPGKTITLVE